MAKEAAAQDHRPKTEANPRPKPRPKPGTKARRAVKVQAANPEHEPAHESRSGTHRPRPDQEKTGKTVDSKCAAIG